MNLTTTEYLLVCLDRQIFLSLRSTLHGREGKGEENKVSSRNSNYSAILPMGKYVRSGVFSCPLKWLFSCSVWYWTKHLLQLP